MKVYLANFLALISFSTLLCASKVSKGGVQLGWIASVRKQEIAEPHYSGGDNPSDAPLHSLSYAYIVQVRTTCGTYEGYYQSPYDFLPSQIVADNQLPVRVAKHGIYFELAGGREMQMYLIHRKQHRRPECQSQSSGH